MIKLVFEDTNFFHKYAVLEDKKLLYLEVLEKNKAAKLGDIYFARVKNVVKGLNAAFLDLGEDVGFLPDKNLDLKNGDELLVQVIKEGNVSKKPKLAKEISLKGNYVVYLPDENNISISKKIKSDKINEIADKLKLDYPDTGLIIRTQSDTASYEAISRELEDLKAKYTNIKQINSIGLIASENEIEYKISELISKFKVDFICTNNNEFYKNNKLKYAKKTIQIEYKDNYCFNHSGINLENLLNQHIKFENFSLYIQKTEAMTVVDIDSGYIKNEKISDINIYEINVAAIEKIFEIIDILDIGGIIVVDLINMTQLNKEKLDFYLQDMVKSHKKKIKVSPITKSSLLEITRQKSNSSLLEKLTNTCSKCSGSGREYSDKFILDDFELDLRNMLSMTTETEVKVLSSEKLYIKLSEELKLLEELYNCKLVFIKSDDDINKMKIIIN